MIATLQNVIYRPSSRLRLEFNSSWDPDIRKPKARKQCLRGKTRKNHTESSETEDSTLESSESKPCTHMSSDASDDKTKDVRYSVKVPEQSRFLSKLTFSCLRTATETDPSRRTLKRRVKQTPVHLSMNWEDQCSILMIQISSPSTTSFTFSIQDIPTFRTKRRK